MADAIDGVLTYLRMVDSLRGERLPTGFTYASYEDLVLDRGTVETSHALTREQMSLVAEYSRKARPKLKECYYNAQKLALYAPDRFVYREGWAQGSTIPVMHAWCVLDGKCVIDLTWRSGTFASRAYTRSARRIRGVLPKGWVYLGVSYTSKEINENLWKHKAWHSFHDDWKGDHAVLKTPRNKPRVVLPLRAEIDLT